MTNEDSVSRLEWLHGKMYCTRENISLGKCYHSSDSLVELSSKVQHRESASLSSAMPHVEGTDDLQSLSFLVGQDQLVLRNWLELWLWLIQMNQLLSHRWHVLLSKSEIQVLHLQKAW